MQFDEALKTDLFSNFDFKDDSENFEKYLSNRLQQQPINAKSQAKTLRNFAVACGRTGVSSRAAAMIATAPLHGISERDEIKFDKNKVLKERDKRQDCKTLTQ